MISNALDYSQIETDDHNFDVVESIQPREFLQRYIKLNRPVKITGMMDAWPAMKKWDMEFFLNLESPKAVHLEEGNVMQENTSFRKSGFREFVRGIIEGEQSGYLSVFRIFDYFPQLRDDVEFDLLNQFKVKSSVSGWLGPAGTVTGYHIDWGDNILAQVIGRKCLHLAAPDATPDMYVSRKFDQGTTISSVDFEHVDPVRFPSFSNVKHHRVILNPGEMIFIPRGWWHHVRSLDTSVSVSNIAFATKDILRDVVPHRLKQILHDAGIWKCDCTCHVVADGKWVRK